MKDSQRKAMFAKRKYNVDDVVNKLNSNLDKDWVPRSSNHIREFENLGNGKVKFKYSGGRIDDDTKRLFKTSGFKISNVNNIIDSGHMDVEGKLS